MNNNLKLYRAWVFIIIISILLHPFALAQEFTGEGEHSPDMEVITIALGDDLTMNFIALTTGVITEIAVGSSVDDYIIGNITVVQNDVTLAEAVGHTWKYDDYPLIVFGLDNYTDVLSTGAFEIRFQRTGGVQLQFQGDPYVAFPGTLFNYSAQNMIGRHSTATVRPFLTFNETAVDTCTCAGLNQDWEIAMSDYCNITDACDLGTGTLSFTGAGWCKCNASVDTTNLGDPGSSGVLYIQENCKITID